MSDLKSCLRGVATAGASFFLFTLSSVADAGPPPAEPGGVAAPQLMLASPVVDEDSQTGYTGTDGDDTITGLATLDVLAFAQALGVDFPIFGSGDFDGSVTAVASAGGVDALAGADTIGIVNPVVTTADAAAFGADVTGALSGEASADISVSAMADSVGLDAGDDGDTSISVGPITSNASADATAVSVAVSFDGELLSSADAGDALVEAGTLTDARAAAIRGGNGTDQINNVGNLTVGADATSTAVGVSVGLAFGDDADVSVGAALSDSSSVSTASAAGIEAGEGDDTVVNSGAVGLYSAATATGVAVGLDVSGSLSGDVTAGGALSDARTSANTSAIGLDGGAGADTIDSAGAINIVTDSDATSVSADYSLTVSQQGSVSSGGGISDVSSIASTDAAGIDGGDGDDAIIALAPVETGIDILAESTATGVAVIYSAAGSLEGGAQGGDALSKSRTDADTSLSGISGGGGGDAITNATGIDGEARATATAVSAGISVSITNEGDATAGGAVSDASSAAVTHATGIDGGDGDDTITSVTTGGQEIWLLADSNATGVAASFSVAGSVKGGAAAGDALSEARTDADAAVVGIAGGSGMDTIDSNTSIDATAASTATAVSAGFSVSIGKEGDVAAGAAVSDASSLAMTRATGIDGGAGDDAIGGDNGISGGIDLRADSEATGVAASFSVAGSLEGGAAAGDALSQARTDADASVSGIAGGAGNDTIRSATDIDATAESTATAVSASFSVEITEEGDTAGDVSGGGSMSDASSLANTRAVGIDGGDGDDTISSTTGGVDAIELLADSAATAVSASFTVAGSVKGAASAGDALSEARTDAVAQAIGIGGGAGVDSIDSNTYIDATAESTAVTVGAAFSVGISKEGDASAGAAISDASSLALTRATGIDGGADGDVIGGENGITGGIDLLADSEATGVAASFSVAGSAEGGAAAGDALSQARTDADAGVMGISGGSGNDTIRSATDIDATAESTATAVSASFSVEITAEGDTAGDVSGSGSLSDASSLAVTRAVGIDGGDGDDAITSATDEEDEISLLADSAATGVAASFTVSGSASGAASAGAALSEARTDALAEATGIAGGSGMDTIHSNTYIDATAESTATAVSAGFSVAISKGGDVTSGDAVSDATSLAMSRATGIDGGADDDIIGGEDGITGGMKLFADAEATGVAASFSVAGSVAGSASAGNALSTARTEADAGVTGIAGGSGSDTITSRTGVDADAEATATAVSAAFTVEITKEGDNTGQVSGAAALSDASTFARAQAIGIDGGDGGDTINNDTGEEEIIDARSRSTATGVAVSVQVSGQMLGDVATEGAISDASAAAESLAAGIEGGAGNDTIENASAIVSATNSTSTGVSAGVGFSVAGTGDVEGGALSDATSSAAAMSAGISGGEGDDGITNTGGLWIRADTDATGVAVSVSVAGSARGDVASKAASDATVDAESLAVGIDGGDGDDTILNEGFIRLMDANLGVPDVDADAIATAVAVSLDVAGSLEGNVEGEALSDSSATATATGIGIAGGAGVDSIENYGNVIGDIGAEAVGVAVAVGVKYSSQGEASGAALTDTSANATATASGIDGGGDADTIDNFADLDLRTDAESDSVAVSVEISGSMKGVASGKAMADASANSLAQSTGIAGSGGNDVIGTNDETGTVNERFIRTDANSDAAATAVSVTAAGAIGVSEGSTVADSSATAESRSAGIDGGDDDDEIDNTSAIVATADADATASSTSVTVTFGIGAADTIGTGNSSATARSTATGIEGGGGNDNIVNAADIFAGASGTESMANANADTTSVAVGISAGYSESEASANSAALAEANAFAISGGAGDDTIINTGNLRAGIATEPSSTSGPLAVADAASKTVEVRLSVGSSVGSAASDSSTNAVSNVAGIAGGDGADEIENHGLIDAYSSARATSESNTTTVSVTLGASEGDAQASAASHAVALASGIDGGRGADGITSDENLDVMANSVAWSDSSSLNLSIASIGTSRQSAEANSSSSADSIARGIYGGAGGETITASGLVTVDANSLVYSRARANTVAGLSAGVNDQHAKSRAETNATSLAVGIDGGEGDDTINGGAVMELHSYAKADSSGVSSTNSGLNIAGESTGEAYSDATAAVTAESVGIRGGIAELAEGESDADIIVNTAPITVTSTATGSSSSKSSANVIAVFGSAEGEAVSDASATVLARSIGIDGGADDDRISTASDEENETDGDLVVTATASATVLSTSRAQGDVGFGDASTRGVSDASARVAAEAVSIEGGSGDDVISTGRLVTVVAETTGNVTSDSQSDAAVGFGSASSGTVADASVEVEAKATGISSGAGGDDVFIGNLVNVTATSAGTVTSTSNSNANTTFGDASSGAISDASANRRVTTVGVDGGSGNDTIEIGLTGLLVARSASSGSVASTSHANADAGLFGDASSSTVSKAASEGSADALGITGGADDDHIINRGVVNTEADAYLTVTTKSIAIADSTFGDAFAGASSDSTARGRAGAMGISADSGNDEIELFGTLGVNAIADANISGVTVALADSTFGDAGTVAGSRNTAGSAVAAAGIDGGDGNDVVTALGAVAVVGEADVTVSQLTVSGSGPASSDARTVSMADVSGIDVGAGDDEVTNGGDLLVAAAPHVGVATRTYGKGGFVDGRVGIDLSADARGISGGDGQDMITNDGTLLVIVGRQADSTVTSDAAAGTSVLIDSDLEGHAAADVEGRWVRIDRVDAPPVFGFVESFDSESGEMTLRDPLPGDFAAGTAYTLFDVDGTGPDIVSSTVDIGGRARVNAATEGDVAASGISGGEGDDELTNSGEIAVRASNATVAGSRTVANNIQADLSTLSSVRSVGMDGDVTAPGDEEVIGGADVLTNLGVLDVEARSTIDFGSSKISVYGVTAAEVAGVASASAAGMQGGGMNDTLTHEGTMSVTSLASIEAEQRATNYFGTVQQSLEFAASGESIGLAGGSGDDDVTSSGLVDVTGTADATVLGATSSLPYYNFLLGVFQQRTNNVVDVVLDSGGRGLDLGTGNDLAESTGTLHVEALAVPTGFSEGMVPGCPSVFCVARAISDYNNYSETGASASARNTAVASGIAGDQGEHDVTGGGEMDVTALAVATSYAQASEVLVADDQSRVTRIGAPGGFVDQALVGTEVDFVGKLLRFPETDQDFLRLESSVTATNGGLEDNQFEDEDAAGLDPALVLGTRIRFPEATGPDFLSEVIGFEDGVFTLADALPSGVARNDPYTLSVIATTVTAFNANTGAFELSDELPEGVGVGSSYTVSIVSDGQPAGGFTFVDATRIDEASETLVNNWISFPDAPDFVAFVSDFDPTTGTFTLDREIPVDLSATDIYELSAQRNGASGSTAIARASGIDLGGGNARVDSGGSIDVRAIAQSQTRVLASRGVATASADSVAEAVGIRTRDGDDSITNRDTGEISVEATVSSNSNTGTRSSEALASGIDAGEGTNLVDNAGVLDVQARLLDEEDVFGSSDGVVGAAVGAIAEASRAEAWGVRTGSGADTVLNSGSISVTAELGDATAEAGVMASGITTGAGNDVVHNDGTVSARMIDMGVVTDGIGIDLGEGDDQLYLGAASATTGSVDLGGGDDVLHLFGNPVIVDVAGETLDPLAGEGTDTLVLHLAGEFAGLPNGFEEAEKLGNGSYLLPGLDTLQRLRIDAGELVLDSSYAFSETGLHEAVIYSDGTHGQLQANGTVSLGGTLDVEKRGQTYISDGTRYELVTATDEVTGEFADVLLPDSTPLLAFELSQQPASLDVVAVASPFESVASNLLLARVAANLDTIADGASGDFSNDMGYLQSLTGGFDRALESYSPDAHQVVNEGATKVIQQSTALLQSHLRDSRARYRGDDQATPLAGNLGMFMSSSGYAGIGLASAAMLPIAPFGAGPDWSALQGGAGGAMAATGRPGGSARSQAWVLGMGSRGDYDVVDGYTAFEQDTSVIAGGYDFHVNDSLLLGLSGGRADTDLEMADAVADGNVKGWFGNAYGSWFTDRSYLEWGLTYNRQEIDARRMIEIGEDTRTAESAHDGSAMSVFVGGGRMFRFDRWILEPHATLQYFSLDEDGFSETGADELGLAVESRDTTAMFGEVAVTLGQQRPFRDGNLDWRVMLGVNYDFDIDERRIDYAYLGAPGNILSLDGREITQASTLFGGGITFNGERVGLALEYRGRFNSDYDEQSAAATLSIRF